MICRHAVLGLFRFESLMTFHDTNDANAVERAAMLMTTVFATVIFTMSLSLPQTLIELPACEMFRHVQA